MYPHPCPECAQKQTELFLGNVMSCTFLTLKYYTIKIIAW